MGARSGVPALQPYCSQRYPVQLALSIPDQIRAEEFLRELAEREEGGEDAEPEHPDAEQRPHQRHASRRRPRPRAMVADNDLALGRIVEGISKSRFWSKSLILVVEDDAQDGVDHVDGHRTVALAIGPHIRRNAVDSNNYNHTSMIRTIQEIFRIPPAHALPGGRARHDQHLHRAGRPDAVRAPHPEGGARRDESAAEGALPAGRCGRRSSRWR